MKNNSNAYLLVDVLVDAADVPEKGSTTIETAKIENS
jgi:hypothetical protein